MSVVVWITAAGLGGVGAILRFVLDGAVSRRIAHQFPYGTLVVNLSGSLILGLITGLAVTGDAATLIGAATIGSFTTFSTWMLESQRLTEEGEMPRAFANLAVSLVLGLLAAALGRSIGAHL
jgi:fluoride exporter